MVICRPACAPFVSPAQPCTQPPSPSMMLGPASSSAAGAGATGRWVLPPQRTKAPPAITTSKIAMVSLPLRDPTKDPLLPGWMDAKLGIVSAAEGARAGSLTLDAGGSGAGLLASRAADGATGAGWVAGACGVDCLTGTCGVAPAGLVVR